MVPVGMWEATPTYKLVTNSLPFCVLMRYWHSLPLTPNTPTHACGWLEVPTFGLSLYPPTPYVPWQLQAPLHRTRRNSNDWEALFHRE